MSPEGYIHPPERTRAQRRRDAMRIKCRLCREAVLRRIDENDAAEAQS